MTMIQAREFLAARFASREKPLSKNAQRKHDEELKLLASFIAYCEAQRTFNIKAK